MAAIDTFDWFRKEVWNNVGEETRVYLDRQRGYLLTLRNENERRRFVEELMAETKSLAKKAKAPSG